MANARGELSTRRILITEINMALLSLAIAEMARLEGSSFSIISMMARLQSYVSVCKVGVVMGRADLGVYNNEYYAIAHATVLFGLFTAVNLAAKNPISCLASAAAALFNGINFMQIYNEPGCQEMLKDTYQFVAAAPRKVFNSVWTFFTAEEPKVESNVFENKKTI